MKFGLLFEIEVARLWTVDSLRRCGREVLPHCGGAKRRVAGAR